MRQEIDSLLRVYQKLVATNARVLTGHTTGTGPGTTMPSNGSACEVGHGTQLLLVSPHPSITVHKTGLHKFPKKSRNYFPNTMGEKGDMKQIPHWEPKILQSSLTCKLHIYLVFDVHKSVHRNINLTERTNKMRPCSHVGHLSGRQPQSTSM
jgi:hypothetical protein